MSIAPQWAEFGLMGMVIGALFVVVGWFLRALSRKDEFIKDILRDDREERAVERVAHSDITNGLSEAIKDLTKELRNKH